MRPWRLLPHRHLPCEHRRRSEEVGGPELCSAHCYSCRRCGRTLRWDGERWVLGRPDFMR